jgi:type I restriction enzyme M protein
MALSEDEGRVLVLSLAFEALERVVAAGVTAHRQQVIAAVENLWDKYRVSLTDREQTRSDIGGKLNDMLMELGYA